MVFSLSRITAELKRIRKGAVGLNKSVVTVFASMGGGKSHKTLFIIGRSGQESKRGPYLFSTLFCIALLEGAKEHKATENEHCLYI
jgi:hypothetical protein